MKKGAINPEEPFSGETIPVDVTPNISLIEEIIELSNKKYTLPYKSQEKTNSLEEEEEKDEETKKGTRLKGKKTINTEKRNGKAKPKRATQKP